MVVIWCSWGVHACSMGCSWGIHAVFMGCSCGVHGVFMGCSWGVHDVFMMCSWGVHGVFICVMKKTVLRLRRFSAYAVAYAMTLRKADAVHSLPSLLAQCCSTQSSIQTFRTSWKAKEHFRSPPCCCGRSECSIAQDGHCTTV